MRSLKKLEPYSNRKGGEANELKKETGLLKQDIKDLSEELHALEEKEHNLLLTLPNVPHPSVKARKDEQDNEEVSRSGDIPTLHQNAKPHWDLASDYNLIDFELEKNKRRWFSCVCKSWRSSSTGYDQFLS